jgi:hypothetical protein
MTEAVTQQVGGPGLGRGPWLCGGLEAPIRLVFWLRGSSCEIGFL